jgi:hypothetical protein
MSAFGGKADIPQSSENVRSILMMRAEYGLAQSHCCDTQQTMERDLDLDQHNAMPAEVYFCGALGA